MTNTTLTSIVNELAVRVTAGILLDEMPTPVEQIEFLRTIEGTLIKGLESSLDAGLKAKFRAAGLDIDKSLLPGYPAATFHHWVEIAAAHIYPNEPLQMGVRLIGRRSLPALQDSLIGRALSSGLQLLGPRRTLERSERIFRNNSNYQEMTVTASTDTSAKIAIAYVFGIPGFYQGVFEQTLTHIVKAKNVQVNVLAVPPPGTVLDITWER